MAHDSSHSSLLGRLIIHSLAVKSRAINGKISGCPGEFSGNLIIGTDYGMRSILDEGKERVELFPSGNGGWF